eukprot:COSAG01_NODE_25636_length_738_cov_12.815336_1_plen_97_part_01
MSSPGTTPRESFSARQAMPYPETTGGTSRPPQLGQLVESPLRSRCELAGPVHTSAAAQQQRQQQRQTNALHGGPQAVMADATPAGFSRFRAHWLPTE